MKNKFGKCLVLLAFSFAFCLSSIKNFKPFEVNASISTKIHNEDFTNPSFSDVSQFQLWKRRVDSKNNIPKSFTNVKNEKFNLVENLIIDLGTERRTYGWWSQDETYLHKYGVMYVYKLPENIPVDATAMVFSSYDGMAQVSLTREAGLQAFIEADHKIGAGFANNAVGGSHSLQAAIGATVGYDVSIKYEFTDSFTSDLYAFDPFPVYNFSKILIGVIQEKVYFTRNFFLVEENPKYESELKGVVLTLPSTVTFKCGSSLPIY